MKYFIAACALLAVANAVPIQDLIRDDITGLGMMKGYGGIMDFFKTRDWMGGKMGKYTGIYKPYTLYGMYTPYNPIYHMWSSFGGIKMPYDIGMGMDIMGLNTMGMGINRPDTIYKYGLMGKLNGMMDLMYGVPDIVDDIMYRDMNMDMRNILTDKMACYTKYGVKGCHLMKTMVPKMMDYFKY